MNAHIKNWTEFICLKFLQIKLFYSLRCFLFTMENLLHWKRFHIWKLLKQKTYEILVYYGFKKDMHYFYCSFS